MCKYDRIGPPHLIISSPSLWPFIWECKATLSQSHRKRPEAKLNYFTSTDPHKDISKRPRWHHPSCASVGWGLSDFMPASSPAPRILLLFLRLLLASSAATICAGLICKLLHGTLHLPSSRPIFPSAPARNHVRRLPIHLYQLLISLSRETSEMLLHHRSSRHDAPRSPLLAVQHNPEKPSRYAKHRDATAHDYTVTNRTSHKTQAQTFASKLQDQHPCLNRSTILGMSPDILSGISSDIFLASLGIISGIFSNIPSDSLSGISSAILSDVLSGISSDILAVFLAHLLATFLALFLTVFQTVFLAHCLRQFFWHSFWHLFY